MEIKQAEFSLSAPVVSMCPKDTKPEYAFIGRSNVGKSSLINMLTNNRKLAKTSSTPGKTLLINHFIINKEWYLVDLPGYGFAKRSKKEVDKLDQMIRGYILQREQLVNVPSSSPRPTSSPLTKPVRPWRLTRRSSWKPGRNCPPCSSPPQRRRTVATMSSTTLNKSTIR